MFTKRPFRKLVKSILYPCSFSRQPISFTNPELYFNTKYSIEERDKILKVLNESENPKDFDEFKISKKRAETIIKFRNENKIIDNLDTLHVCVDSIDTKTLEGLFKRILRRDLPKRTVKELFPPDKIDKCRKVLSIKLTGNKFSWNLIERFEEDKIIKLRLKALNVEELEFTQKSPLLVILNQMKIIGSKLPYAHLLLYDEPQNSLSSSHRFVSNSLVVLARSMLFGILIAQQNPPEFLPLKTNSIGRTMKTLLGGESVSGQHIIEALLESSSYLEKNGRIQSLYFESNSTDKECLASAMLINLAYWRLTKQITDS